MWPVTRNRDKPHLLVELDRGGHGGKCIDSYALVTECSGTVEKGLGQNGPESRSPMVFAHVDPLDLAYPRFQSLQSPAGDHRPRCKRKNDLTIGRPVGSGELSDLSIELCQPTHRSCLGGIGRVPMSRQPLSVLLEQPADRFQLIRPIDLTKSRPTVVVRMSRIRSTHFLPRFHHESSGVVLRWKLTGFMLFSNRYATTAARGLQSEATTVHESFGRRRTNG